jgi:hypothetical protein
LKQADFKGQVNAEGGRIDANRDYLTGALALDLDLAN